MSKFADFCNKMCFNEDFIRSHFKMVERFILGGNKSKGEVMEDQLFKFVKSCFMAALRRLGVEIKATCNHLVCTLRKTISLLFQFLSAFKGDLSEDDIDKRVIKLRKLILEDDKLQSIRNDDAYLLRFLNCTDFDVNLAFKKVQDFHDLILENREWFKSDSPLNKKNEIQKNAKAMMLKTDKDGRSIYLCKLGKMESDLMQQLQIDEMWFESVLDDPKIQATGISVIVDMNGCTWRSFRWLTPSNLLEVSRIIELYPCKEIMYHVVNTSFWVTTALQMIWPFITDDIKNKIKFHFDSWPSLHQHIDPNVLPPEYGGCGPNVNFNELNEWLFSQDSRIRKNLEYRKLFKNK